MAKIGVNRRGFFLSVAGSREPVTFSVDPYGSRSATTRVMRTAATLVCLCALASPSLARADFRLVAPVSRYQADSRTDGPCGFAGDARGADVTTVRSGSLLRVTWQETSAHPSHF